MLMGKWILIWNSTVITTRLEYIGYFFKYEIQLRKITVNMNRPCERNYTSR